MGLRGGERVREDYRGWLRVSTSPKDGMVYLVYSIPVRDSAERGLGRFVNRYLNHLVEFVLGNVRDCPWRRRPAVGRGHLGRVGASIVVGGRESRPQGEGRQREGDPD